MRAKILIGVCLTLFTLTASVSAMGDEHNGHVKSEAIGDKTIMASGTVKSIAQDHMSLRIFHDPIPALKWPAMNMPFEVVDHELTHPLEVGDRVNFEFVQKDGKDIIVRMRKQ
ncbi:MAG: copper-binding protein [Sulfuricurvum sp.]|jgi:Cu(I)/Ag(I) efflux system protein CusF